MSTCSKHVIPPFLSWKGHLRQQKTHISINERAQINKCEGEGEFLFFRGLWYTVKKIRKFRGPFTVDLLRIRSVLRNTESLLLRKAEFSPPARIFRRHYFQCGQCLPKFLQVTRKVGNRLVVWNENENGVPPCSPSYIKLVSIGSW